MSLIHVLILDVLLDTRCPCTFHCVCPYVCLYMSLPLPAYSVYILIHSVSLFHTFSIHPYTFSTYPYTFSIYPYTCPACPYTFHCVRPYIHPYTISPYMCPCCLSPCNIEPCIPCNINPCIPSLPLALPARDLHTAKETYIWHHIWHETHGVAKEACKYIHAWGMLILRPLLPYK